MDYLKFYEGNYDWSKGEQRQQSLEDQAQAYQLKNEYDDYQKKKIEEYYADKGLDFEDDTEYLVDGAILQCDRATLELVPVGTRNCKAVNGLTIGKLRVGEGKRKAAANGLKYANIFDTILNDHIKPFRCNCSNFPDRDTELAAIEADEECETQGNCRDLIKLNRIWYNLPNDTGKEYQSYEDKNGEKKIGIHMGACLFCKHGGFITPVKSGQIINIEMPVPPNSAGMEQKVDYIRKFLEAQGFSKECIAGILGNIYAESGFDTTKEYAGHTGLFQLDGNRWDNYLNWREDNNYKDDYAIDAQCAYMLYEFQAIDDSAILLNYGSQGGELFCTYEEFYNAKNYEEAALIFAAIYEICFSKGALDYRDGIRTYKDLQDKEKRVNCAKDFYEGKIPNY